MGFYPPQDAPSETFRVCGEVSVFSDKFLRLSASGFPLFRDWIPAFAGMTAAGCCFFVYKFL
ncbi:hypothetical protein C5B25_07335 [Neisseria gonorrhoeae]|nr:hypothetical protein C5B25_07335 [Neisseria gonorrhoeae]